MPKNIRVNLHAWRILVWPRIWLHLKVRFCMLLER
jgi:hypothetical protein